MAMMCVMATDSIGTRIRKRRQELAMKQSELARAVGVSDATVSNWEGGKHFPLRYLGKIEAVLGLSLTAEPRPSTAELLEELAAVERRRAELRAELELDRGGNQVNRNDREQSGQAEGGDERAS